MIGGWRVKYLKAKRSKGKKRKTFTAYARRNRALPTLGYGSYSEYLASDEWKDIKARLLAKHRRCLTCDSVAQVVHHLSYDDRTMLGIDETYLACLCHACHERIEIDEEWRKRTLKGANKALLALARAAGREEWAAHAEASLKRLRERVREDAEASAKGDEQRKGEVAPAGKKDKSGKLAKHYRCLRNPSLKDSAADVLGWLLARGYADESGKPTRAAVRRGVAEDRGGKSYWNVTRYRSIRRDERRAAKRD